VFCTHLDNHGKTLRVNVQILTHPDLFEVLHDEWNTLLQNSHTNTVFGTWEWNSHWWQAYQPGDLWVITFRNNSDELIGIAPFFIDHDDEKGRVVRFIGGEDVTDYQDVIVSCQDSDAVYSCLAHTLGERHDAFDVIDICNIPQDSPTRSKWLPFLEENGLTATVEQNEVCPIIPLPETFDAYLDNVMDSKQGREVRRKMRKAEGYSAQMGSLSWYIVDDTHDINAELKKFMALMASSHPEKAAFLQDPQHVKFFESVMPALRDKGWLQLNFLVIDGEPAATYLNFDYENMILVYNSGLNPNKFSHLSPGIVLLTYNIQHAIEQGRRVFDFLRGNENYKYRMGAQDAPIYRITAQ